MAKRNKYEDSIPWKTLQNYLLLLRMNAFTDTLRADGLQAVGRAQGKAEAFNALLGLPELLQTQEEGLPE